MLRGYVKRILPGSPTGTIPEESPREGYYPNREQFTRGTCYHPSSRVTLEPINNELLQSFIKLTVGQTNAHRGSVVSLNGRDQREVPASTATFRVALPPVLRKNHVPLTRPRTEKPNGIYKQSAFTISPPVKLLIKQTPRMKSRFVIETVLRSDP